MATSDNVVRAGLTPKFKDVEVLTSMLTYNCDPIAEKILGGVPIPGKPHSVLYDPPISEFSVVGTRIPGPGPAQDFEKPNGPGLLLVTSAPPGAVLENNGERHALSKGNVFFVPPNTSFALYFGQAPSSSPLEVYFAYCSE